MTDRKSRYRFTPNSMTLDDPESLTCYMSSNSLGISLDFADLGTNSSQTNKDTAALYAAE